VPAIESVSTIALVYCGVVMILAYAARGASGFGAAAAMPLLSLVIPLKVLIPAWTLIGLGAGIALFGSDRRHIPWGTLWKLVPGCLIGIALGLYIFKTLDSVQLARGLGAAVLIYGGHALWSSFRPVPEFRPPPSRGLAFLAGLGGGIIGTMFGTMASMFFAMYFDAIRMAKQHFRASMTAALLTIGVIRGIGYWAIGEFNREVLVVVAMAAPMVAIGIFIGSRFHHGMSELAFRRTVAGAMIASGLALLVK
jgi:uncharacterized membrane protein YfcA